MYLTHRFNIIALIVCLLLSFGQVCAQQLTPECDVTIEPNRYIIHFVLPEYQIETEEDGDCGPFSEINMDADFGLTDDPGYPSLPYFKLNLLVPQGASNITVTFVANNLENDNPEYPLLPSYMGEIVGANNTLVQLDEDCYNAEYYQYGYTSEFPNGYHQNYYAISSIYTYRFTQGVTLTIFPFSYNPVDGTMEVVRNATIIIEFDQGDLVATIDNINQEQDFKSIMVWLLYDTFNDFDIDLDIENKGDYLIVAAHRDMETYLEYYADYKRSQNYQVEILYLDDWNALGNNYLIRELIYSYGFSNDPDFVLFVGSLSEIPPYMGENDLYSPYSDDPYHPLLGRWIVEGDYGYYPDLRNIINKTMYSEIAYITTTPTIESFSGTGSYIARRQFWKDIQMIDNKYISPMGLNNYTHEGRRFQTTSDAQTAISTALYHNPRLFIYRGHGASDTISQSGLWQPYLMYSLSHIPYLTNSTPEPIGIGLACSLNTYLFNSNFGAKWISSYGGGVEFYSATTPSYRASNHALAKTIFSRFKTLTERINNFPISLWLKLGEWDYLYACQTIPRYNQIYKYNLIGDPTLYVYGMDGNIPSYYPINARQLPNKAIDNDINRVEIYDSSGNLINILDSEANVQQQINRAGVFFIKVISSNGNINIYKILK